MSKITYPDKTTGSTYSGAEATEVKDVVNENDDAATLFIEAFDLDIKADKNKTHSTPETMSGAMTLTWDDTDAITGFGETKMIIGDGNNIIIDAPIFPDNGKIFPTESGKEYLLVFLWNGTNLQMDVSPEITSVSIILMQDNFAGTTIDTGKWAETDPDGIITQNDELLITYPLNTNIGNRTDYLDSVLNCPSVCAIQVTGVDTDPNATYLLQMWDGTSDNEITISGQGTGFKNLVRLLIRKAGSSVYDENIAISMDNTFKILRDGDDISFLYLSAPDTWTIMNPTTNPETVTGLPTLNATLMANNSGDTSPEQIIKLDNFFLTNADYPTSTPS